MFLTTLPNVGKTFDQLTIDDIATVARASTGDPSLSPSVAKVTDQLIDTIGQMVEKDIRTPPKLKEVIKDKDEKNETVETVASVTSAEPPAAVAAVDKIEANGRFQIHSSNLSGDSSQGKAASSKKEDAIKGVAVPVIMDEELDSPPKQLQKIPNVTKPVKDEKKKIVTTKKPARETPTTTPSSGLSTWILLSDNREATTPTSTKKKTVTSTTKKPAKAQLTTVKTVTTKPAKKTTPKPEKKQEPVSALETMVKNQKNAATTRPNQKKKGDGVESKVNDSDKKKVVTVPPAILVEVTEVSATETTNTETALETTTKKKKSSTKKRKKNKNRRKKPAEKSGAEQIIKDVVKQPKQPVGAQFYNFLSREIMPTVGLGLVGVLVTAGLAGLLGYNPFVGQNLPVRRTYESQHGYNPNANYYGYNSEYSDTDGGKNEEVLFREVLSGMPEDAKYGMPPADVSYPESQLYNSQEQAYDANKNPGGTASKKDEKADSYAAPYGSQYDAYTNKEHIGSKYPVYSADSFTYPEKSTTEKFKASAKYSEDETIEKQPEALYRVSSDYSDTSSPEGTNTDTAWHRIGSAMDYPTHMEPGPRRLDLDKMTEKLTDSSVHKRTKRSPDGILARIVRRSNEVVNINLEDERENEIDLDDGSPQAPAATTESVVQEATTLESSTDSIISEKQKSTTTEASVSGTEGDQQPSLIDSFPSESSSTSEKPPSLMDVLRRLAQFKLRLGINFLKATTEAFGKYLEGVQQRVEDSMANDTTFPAMRYAWLGREAPDWNVNDSRVREKRYQRNAETIQSDSDQDEQIQTS